MKRGLVLFLGLLVAVAAGAAWLRAPEPADSSPQAYVQVRLAQTEEVPPQLRAADPMGTTWADHHSGNLPAKAARACGAARFDAVQGSDFFLAIQIPVAEASRPLLQCIRSKGGGYLRFSTFDGQER